MIRTGIYMISSIIKPDRVYIGSAINIIRRLKTHYRDLQNNKHHSRKLQRHYNRYGILDLQWSVLMECDKEKLIINEQFFIDNVNPYFNNCMVAGSLLGTRRSDESKEKMRLAKLGKKHSDSHNAKIGKAHLGYKHSEESRRRISEALIGNKNSLGTHHKVTEEARKNMSESHKGERPWMKGRKTTDEVKKKISRKLKGVKKNTNK